MIDVDHFYLGQALLMKDQENHRFAHFDDDNWKSQHPDIPTASLEEIIALLENSQATVLETLSTLTEVELARPGQHPRGIPYTVRDVFLRLPPHDENHREQILAILARLPEMA